MAFYDTSKSRYLTQKSLGDLNSIADSKIKASQAFAAEMMNINNQATRDFQNLVKTTAQEVKEYIQEEKAKKDFIAGLEALGAKESLINAAKSSTSSRGMKEIVGLGMTEDKHTPNSPSGGEFNNPLTGERRTYAPADDLNKEYKRLLIDKLKNPTPKDYKPNMVDVYNLGHRGLGLLTDKDKQTLINAGYGEYRQQGDKRVFLIDSKKIPETNAWLEARYQNNLLERQKKLSEKKNKAPSKQKQEPLYKVEEKDGKKILQRQFAPLFFNNADPKFEWR